MGTVPYDFTYAQLMIPDHLPVWKKLGEENPWTVFHKRYWNTKWGSRFRLAVAEDDNVNEEDDADEEVGDGAVGEENNAGFDSEGDDLITSDNPTDKAEVETFIPGTKDVTQFLIRAEYIRLYDAVMAHYRNWVKAKKNTGAVITGQPGIGGSLRTIVRSSHN